MAFPKRPRLSIDTTRQLNAELAHVAGDLSKQLGRRVTIKEVVLLALIGYGDEKHYVGLSEEADIILNK